MEWLRFLNLADMPGPLFLVVYLVINIIVVIVSRMRLKHCDPTQSLRSHSVPVNPDPYEIAYLRNERSGAVPLILLRLIQFEYIEADPDGGPKKSEPLYLLTEKGKNPRDLYPVETEMLAWFQEPHKLEDVFRSKDLNWRLRRHWDDYALKLSLNQLMFKHRERMWICLNVIGPGAAVIVGLGLFKFVWATSHGHHNVGMLFNMAVLSLLVLWMVCYPPRISDRGSRYLAQIRRMFEGSSNQGLSYSAEAGITPAAMMMVAALGTTALVGTEGEIYHQKLSAFERNTSSGSCGSMCSSSSCGGGSDSGGGDGGGGCGGCGGGGGD